MTAARRHAPEHPDPERSDPEAVGRLLVSLAARPEARQDDPGSLLDRVPLDRLAEMASYHRVPGTVYRSLLSLGVEGPAVDRLRGVYQMAVLSHGRALSELGAVAAALADLPRPWLVVKGPVLVELGYGDPGARLYEDLDVVVDPADLETALTALERAGARVSDVDWRVLARSGRAELALTLPSGMLGDLHWHLLITPGIRARFPLSMAEPVERRRAVRLGEVSVDTLDPEDGLLYLCLHGSLSGGHQLVWLKDIDQVVASEPPRWDHVVDRATRTGTGLVAALQLDRARRVLGTPVPAPVVEALAGRSAWWRWWSRHDRAVGAARWGGYDSTGRTFIAATSKDTAASVLQLSRSVVEDVLRPAVAGRRAGGDEEVPALYRPAGGAAGRESFLAGVVGGDRG